VQGPGHGAAYPPPKLQINLRVFRVQVQPEMVMVELCKDRVTALVDRDAVEMNRSHCARVKLSGVPARKASQEQGFVAATMIDLVLSSASTSVCEEC
jgi:pheromone shutdown protein TraB